MRARVKRRQRIRRYTIVAAVFAVLLLLVLGFYILLNLGSPRDAYDGKTVPHSELTTLYNFSKTPYGPSPSTSMLGTMRYLGGTPYTSHGKPVVVYFGADFCPYCGIERWSIILALDRFGNFTGLAYMTSGATDGDVSTFTFTGLTYTSNYFIFKAYELQDRNRVTIATAPANYTATWTKLTGGGAYPFLNFNNRTYALTINSNYGLLGNDDWSQVYSSIKAGDALGTEIIQAANLITGAICKVTNGNPGSVCGQAPISGVSASLSSFSGAAPVIVGGLYSSGASLNPIATHQGMSGSSKRLESLAGRNFHAQGSSGCGAVAE